MAKDFDLQSPQWLSIIFEGRNQRYGAYELRNDSSNRHIKALIIVFILGLSAIFLPRIINRVIISTRTTSETTEVTQTQFTTETEEVEEPEEMTVVVPETPDVVLNAVLNTEAKVVDDSEIKAENIAQANSVLQDLNAIMSNQTQEGTTSTQKVDLEKYASDLTKGSTKETEDNKIYQFVQVKPSFPGGEEARLKWLNDNLMYPESAILNGYQGMVQVSFVVEKDGSISNVKVLRPTFPALDKEAIRLVKSMPKWLPGKQNGNAVRSYFTQPIVFRLE